MNGVGVGRVVGVVLVVLAIGWGVWSGWQSSHHWGAWRARAERAESEVARLATQATAARHDAERWRARADSLRTRRDTVLVVRWRTILDTAYVGRVLTLSECRDALAGLRGLCQRAVDSLGGELAGARQEADGYRAGLVAMTTADSLHAVAVDSLAGLVRAVPTPRKWLGFLPVPKVTVGVGCAGGSGFGCGVMAGVGFTF